MTPDALQAMPGRVLEDLPQYVTYNFGCSCGWWGIARLPVARGQHACPKRCGAVYVQWQNGDGEWRLSPWMH